MRRLAKTLYHLAYFCLSLAPVPLLAGHFLLASVPSGLALLAALVLLGLALSLLPGRVGGKAPVSVAPERTRSGSDPDPDRALRSAALPPAPRRAFPLRPFASLLCAAGMAVLLVAFPPAPFAAPTLTSRVILAIVASAWLTASVYSLAGDRLDDGRFACVGFVAYAVAGIMAYYGRLDELNHVLLWLCAAFLLSTALTLNDQSMAAGAASPGKRPAGRLRRSNRRLLLPLAALLMAIVNFSQLRHALVTAARWLRDLIVRIALFLASLGMGETSTGGGGDNGSSDLGGLPKSEAGSFWVFLEKIAFVVAALVLLFLLFLAARKLFRGLRRLIALLKERLRALAGGMAEEYRDEQESLFDWGDVQRSLGETLKKRFSRLTKREPKWERLTARERVRYVVRTLYRRAHGEALSSLTIHEAASRLPLGGARPDELADLYDIARYSPDEPTEEQAERLRKEALK